MATALLQTSGTNALIQLENNGRLTIKYSIRFDKNRTLTHNEINVLLCVEHESLPSLDFHNFYKCKHTQFFE